MFDIFLIIDKLRKKLSLKDVVLILILIAIYFSSRIIKLDTNLPIFSDEGIYIRWAKVAWHDASWRFISLTDGKQPLQTWGTIPFLKIFPDNALLAGRLFSVFTGFFALSGIFIFCWYVFNKKTAYIASFLYIFTPYFLFYDRMALVDSGVNAFFIWILFLSIVLVKTLRVDFALIFGLIGGMALLAKSSVRIFIGMCLFAPILILKRNKKTLVNEVINFTLLFSLGVLISFIIYNIQRLSPFFHYVAEKNKTFIITPEEFLKEPFKLLFTNLKTVVSYSFWESGFILPIFAIFGYLKLLKIDKKLFYYLFVWFLIPYIVISLVSKVLFPRYIIFFGSIYLILASYFLSELKNKRLFIGLLTLIVLINSYFSYPMIFSFENISLPPIDRGQYIEGGTVGLGAKEMLDYAREKSKEKPVIILAEGNFGMSGDVLDVFTKPNDKIFIKGYWPFSKESLLENQKELKDHYVFVVLPYTNIPPSDWPVQVIQRFPKPGGTTEMTFLQLTQ